MLQYLSLGALVLRAPRRAPPSIRCSAELPELPEGAWRPPRIDAGALSVGQIVAGTIVSRGERGYSMDVGTPEPAVLLGSEIVLQPNASAGRGWEELRPGETYEARVVAAEAGAPVQVSMAAAQAAVAWERVEALAAEESIMPGYPALVLRLEADGAIVDVEGLPAFLPWGHWDLGDAPRARTDLIGSRLRVGFLEVDAERGRLVVSHRTVQLQQKLQDYGPGQLLRGTVATVRAYGVVVRLDGGGADGGGGLDALLHVSQISQAYVKDVAKVFAPGDAVTAVVIRVDPKDGVINLSTKMLEAKPGEMLRTKEACFARAAAAGGERVEAVLAAIDGELRGLAERTHTGPHAAAAIHLSNALQTPPDTHMVCTCFLQT